MNKPLLWTTIAVMAGTVVYVAWELSRPQPATEPVVVERTVSPPVVAAPPAIRYPIEAEPLATALPVLDESDAAVGEALGLPVISADAAIKG